MDNKLSELSKPVAWISESNLRNLRKGVNAVYVKNEPILAKPVALYSQEYVSALLQRITELEQLPTIKHMRSVEESMIRATDMVSELEKLLATPVRLPNKNDAEFWFGSTFQVAKFDRAVERAVSAAGFKFVGGE